jgi:hypothetical protein
MQTHGSDESHEAGREPSHSREGSPALHITISSPSWLGRLPSARAQARTRKHPTERPPDRAGTQEPSRIASPVRLSYPLLPYSVSHLSLPFRFTIGNTHIVPRSYISDPIVNQDIQRREQRCRHAGGLGAIVIILQCGGMSQVVPVEVDSPSQLSWDIRDDWEEALEHCVEIGKTDFKPISTTSRG